MFAWSYPLLNVFLTIFWVFLWALWIFLVFWVVFDVFRSHDLSGLGKAGWLILVLLLPFLGIFIYLIARGGKMHEHSVQAAQAQDQALRTYVQQAAGGSAEELSKLADLKDRGVITEDEFNKEKARILGQDGSKGVPTQVPGPTS
jgi:predicted PurR-regulated permease PerM